MLTLSDSNEQIQRWQLYMSQFKFDLVHRPGIKHVNADTWSRRPCVQCGRDEQPSKNTASGKPRRLRKKEDVADIPPCQHTTMTLTILWMI
jgi:hypothetical protein